MQEYTQVHNDEKNIQAIADGYRSKLQHDSWLAEGLQKDAIQNSWDARFDKKHGKNWKCIFSLMNSGNKKFLSIVDKGTRGLIGTRFNGREELSEILLSKRPDEDLAYFLNQDWSAKSVEEGGNRGRGKTLFLFTSRNKKIYFDSLRSSDGRYIFGEIYLDKDKEIKFKLFWDTRGKKEFLNIMGKEIIPLKKIGTRILILNPYKIITDLIENGIFLSFINETWWEILKKFNAEILVNDGKEKKFAKVPIWYEENSMDMEELSEEKKVIKNLTKYRIKRLILRYDSKSSLPVSLRGIAVQRGGMTIERNPSEKLVHEESINNIYGWVEMDKELEHDMKTLAEGPEHLDFSWNRKPAKYLQDYLRIQVRHFAKELKLIKPREAESNKIQRQAECSAIKALTPLFKQLHLTGKHGVGRKSRKKAHRGQDEPFRLSIPEFNLPRENRRINYGERIEGTSVVPINEFNKKLMALVNVWVVSEGGKLEVITEKEITLHLGKNPPIGDNYMKISNRYNKGKYSFRAKMVSLESCDLKLPDGTLVEKGTILYDRINQSFYVEEDPPESGPFRYISEEKENKTDLFRWEPDEGGGYIIYYNSLHPRIKKIRWDKEQLNNYLIEQTAVIALQIKLEELMAENDKSDPELSGLVEKGNIIEVWPTLSKKYSKFLWDFLED